MRAQIPRLTRDCRELYLKIDIRPGNTRLSVLSPRWEANRGPLTVDATGITSLCAVSSQHTDLTPCETLEGWLSAPNVYPTVMLDDLSLFSRCLLSNHVPRAVGLFDFWRMMNVPKNV